MYQTFSDSLHDKQPTEASPDPQHTLGATAVTPGGDGSAPSLSYRTIWALDQRSGENALQWWRVSFPVHQAEWEAPSNSFREHLAGIAKHVDFKINPARKYRLQYKASGHPRAPPTGKLMNNESFTFPNLNILSARPLITALAELSHQPGTIGH